MSKKHGWIICWKSRLTRLRGQGKVVFSESVAKKLAYDMDRKFPDLDHWAFSV